MPKRPDEAEWQYKGRMVELAERIKLYVGEEKAASPHVWHFSHLYRVFDATATYDDIRVACNTPAFTHDFHVRDDYFFAKTSGQKRDDLAWTTGTGRFAQ